MRIIWCMNKVSRAFFSQMSSRAELIMKFFQPTNVYGGKRLLLHFDGNKFENVSPNFPY